MLLIFSIFRSLARLVGYDLEFTNRKRPNPLRLWETDTEFLRLRSEVADNTSMNPRVMFMLYELIKAAPPGEDLAEVGVFKGGSSYLMAALRPSRTVHSFDTFEGMPEVDPSHDWHKKGDFKVDAASVLDFLARKENILTYRGVFPSTSGPVKNLRFGFVHIDVDIYLSVKDCLEFFYPRMVPGGLLVSDDYGAVTCPGAKKAWDEFFADKPESSIYLPTRQCFIIKR